MPALLNQQNSRAPTLPVTVSIADLRDFPQCIELVASWHHEYWWSAGRRISKTERMLRLQRHLGKPALPSTWLAFVETELVGCVSLVDYALAKRSDGSAWLSNLYVKEQARNTGIGTQLVDFVVAKAGAMSLEKLYLFTPDKLDFYQKRGWCRQQRQRVQGQWVEILSHAVAAETLDNGCDQDAN